MLPGVGEEEGGGMDSHPLPPPPPPQALRRRDSSSSRFSDCGSTRTRRSWSVQEDDELLRCVHLYGEGEWKKILNNSSILRERYGYGEGYSGTLFVNFRRV